MKSPDAIFLAINTFLKGYSGNLKVSKESDQELEVIGTFSVQQGRQKLSGHYFASTVLKPKDVRLYFFPIYTHPEEFTLSEDLQKALKGKSCFHIKHWHKDMASEVDAMIRKGVEVYKASGLI